MDNFEQLPVMSKEDEYQAQLAAMEARYGVKLEPARGSNNTLSNAQLWLESHYRFRYNVVQNDIEYHNGVDNEYRQLSGRDLDTIYVRMIKAGHRLSKVNLQALINSREIAADYNEIEDYILSLPLDNGETDWMRVWCDQLRLVDETKRERLVKSFTNWFVNYVDSLLKPRTTNQQIFVLVGRQGIYKTTLLNNLVPKHLQLEYLFSSGRLYFENKDHLKYLATKMLINWDELGTLARNDRSMLKSILSSDTVVLRWQYDRTDTKTWRRASFCGSTNDIEFLTDETGNRRYLIFHVSDIVPNAELPIDRLYAQAVRMIKNNHDYRFARGDVDDIERQNEEFKDTSLEEDLLMKYIKKPVTSEQRLYADYMTAGDINVFLAGQSNRINVNESTKKRINSILRRHDFQMKRMELPGYSTRVRVWLVNKIDTGVNFSTERENEPEPI